MSLETPGLEVPKSRYKKWGDGAFAVVASKLWNSLPSDIQMFQTGNVLSAIMAILIFVWILKYWT